ncbi:MAG: glycogen-binding domain-containing protein [Deltaproteobacteria bacterium]|nr:glycogen-binding domain-containing protein [Deltaproteobacteria bacterium]
MNRAHLERIRALVDGELPEADAAALRLEAARDPALAAELRRQEALHQKLLALGSPALPASLSVDALLGRALARADHERIRAYVDGELKPDAIAELLANARTHSNLDRELQRQLALRRTLASLPQPRPPMPKPQPGWLSLLLGRRALGLSLPAAAAAGLLLFGAGTVVGRRSPTPATTVAEQDLVPVRFVILAGDAQNVSVAGSFNRWSDKATPLAPVGDGVWEATVRLPRGEHRYIFRVDGRWQPDPLAPQLVPDGMGNMDAVIQL